MASTSEILFGAIVVVNRLASQRRVADALQRARGRPLAELLVEERLLTPEQAQQVHRAQALNQFLRAERIAAQLLVRNRVVDAMSIQRAIAEQEKRQFSVRISEILTEWGMLDQRAAERLADEQLNALAEETARLEEAGLEGAVAELARDTRAASSGVTALADIQSSRMRRARGPRGLLDAQPVRRTAPARPAVDESAFKRTLEVDSARIAAAAAFDDADLIGRTIASRYRILEKVGEGGMGAVYKAEHCLMEKVVAVKILDPDLVSTAETLQRFRREVRAAARFQHRNVIQIYDAGEGEGGLFYMAMEFADGQTLEEIQESEGVLPLERSLPLFRQVLSAVGEAHKLGIVHRDLKLANVMVVREKGVEVAKVMDFGIAKLAFDEQEAAGAGPGLYRTQEGVVTGTPQYMSPEQASGEAVDHRSDLYSLGVMLFELVTGRLPFVSDTPMGYIGKHIVEEPPRPSSVARAPIPKLLDEVALRLLEKSPADRYASAEDVIADLDLRLSSEGFASIDVSAALNGSGSASRSGFDAGASGGSTVASGVGGGARRHLLLLGVLGALLVVVLSTALTLAVMLGSDRPSDEEVASALARAEVLLSSDPSAARAVLEPIAAALPERQDVARLLERARERASGAANDDVTRLVKKAEQLVAEFDAGTAGRVSADRALDLYDEALTIQPDPELRERRDALARRLEELRAGAPPTGSSAADRLLLEARDALDAGALDRAADFLRQAEAHLPAAHPDLERLRTHLEAERLVAAATAARQAGRLKDAQAKLAEAIRIHPGGPRDQAALRRMKEEIDAALAAEAQRGDLDRALADCLEAARDLDLEKARAALGRAEGAVKGGTPPTRLKVRQKAIERLAAIGPAWRDTRDRLNRLAASTVGGELLRARELQRALREQRGELDALQADAELHERLAAAHEADLTRAAQLVERFAAEAERAKSDQLRRFERALERIRKRSIERESAAAVDERIEAVLMLKDFPSYLEGEASPEDRAWLDAEAARLELRRQVWAELGPEMEAIPGGRWAPPGGAEVELPKTYYAGSHEVTCVDWKAFIDATGRAEPADFKSWSDEPVRFISRDDAVAYCAWRGRGKRHVVFQLPSEAEWERAARGPEGTRYPWGDAFEDWREGYAAMSGRLERVGSYRKDVNGWGLKDVVGNVHELTGAREGDLIVVRGGSANVSRDEAGVDERLLVAPGQEVGAFIGLRLFAVERSDGAERSD